MVLVVVMAGCCGQRGLCRWLVVGGLVVVGAAVVRRRLVVVEVAARKPPVCFVCSWRMGLCLAVEGLPNQSMTQRTQQVRQWASLTAERDLCYLFAESASFGESVLEETVWGSGRSRCR